MCNDGIVWSASWQILMILWNGAWYLYMFSNIKIRESFHPDCVHILLIISKVSSMPMYSGVVYDRWFGGSCHQAYLFLPISCGAVANTHWTWGLWAALWDANQQESGHWMRIWNEPDLWERPPATTISSGMTRHFLLSRGGTISWKANAYSSSWEIKRLTCVDWISLKRQG